MNYSENEEKAISFVMSFYDISREVTCELYWDEVEAYLSLMEKFENES